MDSLIMITHYSIALPPHPRGFHLITHYIERAVAEWPVNGMLHVFIQHTSAGICINENADPDVLQDFNMAFERLVPEKAWPYVHTLEGPDDMPAHIKSVLSGNSISVPIIGGKMALGTWQGIYLCEFRNRGGSRRLVISVIS